MKKFNYQVVINTELEDNRIIFTGITEQDFQSVIESCLGSLSDVYFVENAKDFTLDTLADDVYIENILYSPINESNNESKKI